MKFGYDRDGKLVPIEQLELASALADLEAQHDSQGFAARATAVVALRRLFAVAGQPLAGEDENVLSLYAEGIVDYHNVEHYFGQRLTSALELAHARLGSA